MTATDRGPGGSWLGWGNGPARTGFTPTPVARRLTHWFAPVAGRVTSEPVVVRDVPAPGETTVFVGTSAGRVYAFAGNGYVRWVDDFGQLDRPCRQLDGYGITGTAVADTATHALYVADAFGWLHALDLMTGAEHAGWPVRVFSDFEREHVFGGLLLAGGSVYVPTASFCDGPMEGRLIRVSLATRSVTPWVVVPAALGGGGGIWGFGGAAYSARRDSIFVATGNAFEGGTNVGRRYRESAGLGERIVELSPDLRVRSSSHPGDVRQRLDLDFSSGPVLALSRRCGELVAALNKNGRLYAWRAARLRSGPLWSARLRRARAFAPAIGQPAWSPRTRSFYFAGGNRVVRVSVTPRCRARIAWTRRLPPAYTHGSPTVAGGTVWFSVSSPAAGLVGIDARTGRTRARVPLDGDAYAAPTAASGALYLGTFSGGVHGLVPRAARFGTGYSAIREHRSFADPLRGWQSRESGVYATEDGGATWRRILRSPAERVVRASTTFGAVSVGFPAARCGCRTRVLWTIDGGRHWRPTRAIRGPFEGRGDVLYFHDRTRLFVVRIRGRRLVSRRIARVVAGSIVDLANVPGGIAALVSSRVAGRGWDQQPRLVLATGETARTVRLPLQTGSIVVQSVTASWPQVVVRGRDFATGAAVAWTSFDGGVSWRVARG